MKKFVSKDFIKLLIIISILFVLGGVLSYSDLRQNENPVIWSVAFFVMMSTAFYFYLKQRFYMNIVYNFLIGLVLATVLNFNVFFELTSFHYYQTLNSWLIFSVIIGFCLPTVVAYFSYKHSRKSLDEARAFLYGALVSLIAWTILLTPYISFRDYITFF